MHCLNWRPFSCCLSMNIVVWNCRGSLKPKFQSYVQDLVRLHDPTLLVVMETCVGGSRARDITNRLPFDGAIILKRLTVLRGSRFYGIQIEWRCHSLLVLSRKFIL